MKSYQFQELSKSDSGYLSSCTSRIGEAWPSPLLLHTHQKNVYQITNKRQKTGEQIWVLFDVLLECKIHFLMHILQHPSTILNMYDSTSNACGMITGFCASSVLISLVVRGCACSSCSGQHKSWNLFTAWSRNHGVFHAHHFVYFIIMIYQVFLVF